MRGFTLIEMVIVIILLGIVASFGAILIHDGLRLSLQSKDTIEATWHSRVAVQRMVKDIRTIRKATPVDLSTMLPNKIVFNSTSGESITFELNGNNLLRNTQVLADGLDTLTFGYLDTNNQPTTVAPLVRCISIYLRINKGKVISPIQTVVCPRNF